MDAQATQGLLRFFQNVIDHRADNARHYLGDIIAIALMAVLCGAEGWPAVAAWGELNLQWLKALLPLPHGIASHDTFDRVFRRLDPMQFEKCFQQWTKALVGNVQGLFVAVDGKTARRSWKRAWSKTPVHMVSAFVAQNHLILGQLATDCKSNEITAIPKLLALLQLAGCTVTIDAMGCQRDILAVIRAQKADCILALKENQPTLHQKVKKLMDEGIREGLAGMEHGFWEETQEGHGRRVKRRVWVSTEVKWLGQDLLEAWPGLASMIVVESEREDYGDVADDGRVRPKVSGERRYYISTHAHTNARFFAEGIRCHWGVESMHWSLDVSMNEDQSRLRMGDGAENFSRLRRTALNQLKRWQPKKSNGKPLRVGLKTKQQMCGWSRKALAEALLA
jgi:predicted transposase YbfD/YdcC